jgi:hypothetical protein
VGVVAGLDGTTDITPNFLKAYFRGLPYGRDDVYDKHSAMSFAKSVKTRAWCFTANRAGTAG